MNNQATNINNDETRIDNQNDPAQNENTEMTGDNLSEETKGQNKTGNITKKLAAGGLGVIGGVVGLMGLSAFRPAPLIEDPNPDSPAINEPQNIDDIKLAHTPNDNMSFNSAFAAARQEVGPHGVFEWRDGVYGTYYANEWNGLSDEYKTKFNNQNWKTDFANDPQQMTQQQERENPVMLSDSNDAVVEMDVNDKEYEIKFGEHEIKTDENGHEYISLTDAVTGDEVRVNPEDLKYAVLDKEGELVGVITEDALATTGNDEANLTGYYELDENGNSITFVANENVTEDIQVETLGENSDNQPGDVEIAEVIDTDDDNVVILNAPHMDANTDTAFVPEMVDGNIAFIDTELDGEYDIAVLNDEDSPIAATAVEQSGEPQQDDILATEGDDKSDYLSTNNLPDYSNDASVDEFLV